MDPLQEVHKILEIQEDRNIEPTTLALQTMALASIAIDLNRIADKLAGGGY